MSASSAASAAPKREFGFDIADHRAISKIVYDEVGILLPEGKSQLVYGRVAKRVRALGMSSVADYVALIRNDGEERGRMIDALTTNHTSFFRESHHFDDFAEHRWPALADRLAKGGRVRLWSSACSTGEEPYTWLMAMLGTDRAAANRLLKSDFKMLATDVSPSALDAARAGEYTKQIVRTVPAGMRSTWLSGHDDKQTVDRALRDMIAFRPLNLLTDWPIKQRFDAIFCRNVMIYFDEPTKERLQARLADKLELGGMMYIGHSERMIGPAAGKFKCIGRTAYQKVSA
ncbi:MAG: protein-glutamate O-methyltransferase CheR [Sphingomonas bacterium]|nr:protein-glutamate O-methyltransferase CheR [Sphingomonas bacterium]